VAGATNNRNNINLKGITLQNGTSCHAAARPVTFMKK
jgi:hypothetical protein